MVKVSNKDFLELVELYNKVDNLAELVLNCSIKERLQDKELVSEFKNEWTFFVLKQIEVDIALESSQQIKQAYSICEQLQ